MARMGLSLSEKDSKRSFILGEQFGASSNVIILCAFIGKTYLSRTVAMGLLTIIPSFFICIKPPIGIT